MSAACVRAELLRGRGDHGLEAYQLADAFCRQARLRVEELFGRLWSNTDDLDRKVVKNVLGGSYTWLEEGVIDPPTTVPGSPTPPRARAPGRTSAARSAERPEGGHGARPLLRSPRTADTPPGYRGGPDGRRDRTQWGHDRRSSPLADPHLVYDPVAGDGPKDVVILGSTGSIGTQAIDLVLRNPDRFRVTALSANGGRVALLAEQAHRLRVRTVAVAREDVVPELREALSARYGAGEPLPEVLAGPDAATRVAASDCHTVLNGITGSIGLAPTLAALEAGRTLALANKESLIVGGPLVKALAKPGQIIPVDSEHAALFQALAAGTRADVRKLVVTASGGPSAAAPGRSWRPSPSRMPSPTPRGPWARSSRSTPRPSSTRAWRSSRRTSSTTFPSTALRWSCIPSRMSTRWLSSRTDRHWPRRRPRHAGPDRHRPRLARTGPRRGPGLRLEQGVHLGVLPLDDEAFPR